MRVTKNKRAIDYLALAFFKYLCSLNIGNDLLLKYCKYCGAEIPDNAVTCEKCAKPVEESRVEYIPPEQTRFQVPPQVKVGVKKENTFETCGLICLVIVVIVVILYFLRWFI